ncbi:MAG TPA: bifunctional riboflavin kinase/FAD synthetase [Candidatus Acidoferrum sp.]|nr:bifunctional riboflavin kinase/FAD synthetase [Candidatus Acidoferrum sp.]
MKLYRSLAEVPPDFGPSALTIGNFDGVHYGHRRILRRVVEIAREHGWHPSVLTFNPHPTRIVAPARTPALLNSPEQRAALMSEEGIEQVLILPFTQELAQLTPEEFVRRLLVDALGAKAVLVGDNFRFGHRQAGNVAVLSELGSTLGFETEILGAVHCRGRMVSSSAVRELIRAGNVSLAGRFLTHPYAIEGDVVGGRGVGSKQTVPTLNLATTAEVIPASGVYITRTYDAAGDGRWNSITNIGYRPTFGASDELSIESFLLDPFEPPAPARIRLEFLRRVREERKFESPEALRAQILRDVRTAQTYSRRVALWTGRPCISC